MLERIGGMNAFFIALDQGHGIRPVGLRHIKDLDNPFDYSTHGESGTEIPLKPLHDLELRLKNDS